VVFDEEALAAIVTRGLIPLLSVRDRDSVYVGRFQALGATAASPGRRWC
jgi:hypothetical protein